MHHARRCWTCVGEPKSVAGIGFEPPVFVLASTRSRLHNGKPEVEAAVVSIRENPNDHTARVNLRWEGKHQISDFALNKLGTVLNSEDETDQHSGWAIVESPVKATVGKTIPLLKAAK